MPHEVTAILQSCIICIWRCCPKSRSRKTGNRQQPIRIHEHRKHVKLGYLDLVTQLSSETFRTGQRLPDMIGYCGLKPWYTYSFQFIRKLHTLVCNILRNVHQYFNHFLMHSPVCCTEGSCLPFEIGEHMQFRYLP